MLAFIVPFDAMQIRSVIAVTAANAYQTMAYRRQVYYVADPDVRKDGLGRRSRLREPEAKPLPEEKHSRRSQHLHISGK